MRPDERDLEEEIRAHIALSIQERIDRGESREAARLAALTEFGYVPRVRDAMRRVWYSRWVDAAAALRCDIQAALRSVMRSKGVAAAVVLMLALGIGPAAAVFSLVSELLIDPVLSRHHDRLIYLHQSAPGFGADNTGFSIPEIEDFKSRATTLDAFATLARTDLPMTGAGERRLVRAAVVSSAYFDILSVRPVLGRVLATADDAPEAAASAVLTHRFWTTALTSDPAVIGRTIHLGPRPATVVGVLEPWVPYPSEAEIIVNLATSPRHQAATAVQVRTRRTSQLVGRLAPETTIDSARAELIDLHAAMMREHPAAYSAQAEMQLHVRHLREEIGKHARTVLLVLLAVSGVIFLMVCCNIGTLFSARAAPGRTELAVRTALGASTWALRRTLLARSLVLCGGGAVAGVLLAQALLGVVGRYAVAFSGRPPVDNLDTKALCAGAALAILAAVLLAYVPRLPSPRSALASGVLSFTALANRRLRLIAITQIAFSFVLLVAAGTLLTALRAIESEETGYDMPQVLALDIPSSSHDATRPDDLRFFEELRRLVQALPQVRGVALGTFVPWRDAVTHGPGFHFALADRALERRTPDLHARLRGVSPGFFAVLGVRLVAGRDFTPADRHDTERVAIVNETAAERLFPKGDALNKRLSRIDPYLGMSPPLRIVGVVADVNDESLQGDSRPTVYGPVGQMGVAGRLFVRTSGDPYALVPTLRRMILESSAHRLAERAATLEDVRVEVLAADRLDALVFAMFAGLAMLVAAAGVGGVLACCVSAKRHEFGVRLAMGSTARHLLVRVLSEGALIVTLGIAVGGATSYACAAVAAAHLKGVQLPGPMAFLGAVAVLVAVAMVASLIPGWRASRLEPLDALRSD